MDESCVVSAHVQCPLPLIGNGRECSNDTDLDRVPDFKLTIGCDGPEECLKVSEPHNASN